MLQREIDPAQLADIEKFETQLGRYLSGELDDDVFRVFRLNNGIYGQRQGGHNQMVRVKVPYGGLTAEQLDAMAHIADTYSRGWGHITTRQNIQFHFVELERVPDVLRELAAVGMTTREACGDTVRNVQACHLAGACPFEVLDVTPWAEAAFRHFLRHPLAQRLPRKFKINFSGCATDCGQAMFNDVGVIATARENEAGELEGGFRVFVAGGLGANPHPALALEEFTSREELLPTLEAILRVFSNHGNRDNKLRARMKWLVDTMGWDELQARILKERRFLLASSSWPGGLPEAVEKEGDSPAGLHATITPTPMGQGVPVSIRATSPYDRWEQVNVVRGNAKGTVSAIAYAKLGDVTSDQFRALAAIQRELALDVRVTNRQNLAFRGLTEEQLSKLFDRLQTIGMAEPGAELARDVVACPGADTCNLAVTQSRGLADAIGAALDEAGLADVGGIRTNISGCTNSCGQHHISDIGFFGAERRAHGKAAPGYQMLLGGYVGQTQIHFGEKALRLPAKNAPEAAVRVVRRFANEREAGELFRTWLDRVGGAKAVAADLKELDEFPLPDVAPEYYVDYDETGPYVAETGESECAT
ncbi:MAG TPA: nitrite/sulfite reductase [Acidimicrobiales bacterium]|jgi:sulfite reductase beta subunit-like hemoprotein|nr:nitrite/sulfite reductase [Acidimicrobiales bacterium]